MAANDKNAAYVEQPDGQMMMAEMAETSPKQVYMNRVSQNLIRTPKTASMANMRSISIPDPESACGYGYVLVPQANVYDTKDRNGQVRPGLSNVKLGPGDAMLNYQIKGYDGNFIKMQRPAAEISDMWREGQKNYYAQQRAAREAQGVEAQAPEAAKPAEKAAPAYLNRVSVKSIRAAETVSGHAVQRVSVPDPASVDGWGNLLVPDTCIHPSKKKDGTLIPNRFDVYLGDADRKIPSYSIQVPDSENPGQKKFERVDKTAGEIASAYAANQEAFYASLKDQRAKQGEAQAAAPSAPAAQQAVPQAASEPSVDEPF